MAEIGTNPASPSGEAVSKRPWVALNDKRTLNSEQWQFLPEMFIVHCSISHLGTAPSPTGRGVYCLLIVIFPRDVRSVILFPPPLSSDCECVGL